ncbi:MAG: MerR family transcriptional regulator [Ignavibacteria bacterium]|nr:MerR family transcriptional regulator [Ignavibacteria bacterium]MCU7501532.1 MerR family transcriptional regulator [Ignavibacteria bacterium]MCU7515952.1 MerR family transcriptional regulator [Ignavibacteria bacterium]
MKELGIKKLYYSISEVSKITGLEQYVLRYWENEFEDLKPSKNRAGNRIYTNKDIQVILKIKKLLKEEKYTIEGAKKNLKEPEPVQEAVQEKPEEANTEIKDKKSEEVLPAIKRDLEHIRNFLIYLQSKL